MPINKSPNSNKTRFEYSAGGILREADNLLLVKVQNLEGQVVWTFPKGHVEKGETVEQTALREVEEETGYACVIEKPFDRIQYWFKQEGQLIKKTVTWFLMSPLKKTGAHDPDEILETKWVSIAEAAELCKYKSDKKILARLKTLS